MNTLKQILFIDANVSDAQSIIDSISPDMDVYQLDNQTSAIEQIATILNGYQNLDAVHIISHGSEGKLAFANGALSNANIGDYSAQLKRIGSALSATGDLLLYGCDVAKGDDGLAFINTLADLIGADVAGSNDLTGKDGDWILESSIGKIDNQLRINTILSNYQYDLANINGTSGNDYLVGTSENDNIQGGVGNDTIYGGNDDNWDWIDGGAGDDFIDGGTSQAIGFSLNTVTYINAPNAVNVDLSKNLATGYGNDTLLNIEGIQDSKYNDTLIGDDKNNYFRLDGGGDDTVYGGDGQDDIWFENANSGVSVNLITGIATDIDKLHPYIGTDHLFSIEGVKGSYFSDYIQLGNEPNGVFGRAGDDILIGGNSGENFIGGSGNDSIDGGGGFDQIDYYDDAWDSGSGVYGSLGVNVNLEKGIAIDNWGDTDTLKNIENICGSSLDDVLIGDSSNNRIQGQQGADTLTGGKGVDLFVYFGENSWVGKGNRDVITDFEPNSGDKIELYGIANGNLKYQGIKPFSAINQVRYQTDLVNAITLIQINLDNDLSNPEMEIELTGIKNLTTNSFNLGAFNSSNRAPIGTASAILASGGQNIPYTIAASDLLRGFRDADGDSLSVDSLSATHGTLTNNNNGMWTFTPESNYSGVVNLTYNVMDTKNDSISATQSFSILTNPKLSVNDSSTNENDTGQQNLIFTLTLSKALSQTSSVDYSVQSGTATAGIDFSSIPSGTVQFNAGETSKTITVPVLSDTTIENDETLNLVLSNPTVLELRNGKTSMTATGTIRNDDFPTLTLSGSQSVKENNSGQTALNFVATLSQSVPFGVLVTYATQGITATAGQDFTAQSGTLSFSVGETSKTISIPILEDTLEETDETLALVLNTPQNARFASNATELRSVGTILDDDGQTVRLSSPSVLEGNSGITQLKFVVSLGYAVNKDVTFDYKIEDGTATVNTDYALASNTVTLSAGQQSVEIAIPISGDIRIEPDETIKLTLNSATGIVFPTNTFPVSNVGTILNDDLSVVSLPTSKTTYEPTMGFKNTDIPVTLSAPASTATLISYHIESGSALQDKDFVSSNGKLTISANSSLGVISVPILADLEKEPDETFKVVIDKVDGGAKLPDGQSTLSTTVMISDITLPVLSVQNVSQLESNSGNQPLTFKVSLSAPSTQPITFNVKSVDKTATAGQDYLGIDTATKTIPANMQSFDIPILIVGDKIAESDETFNLVFSTITNAVFESGDDTLTATGTIVDDDKSIILISDAHVTEGNQGFHTETIKVTLSMLAINPVKVHYTLLDGTAKGGEDFGRLEDDLIIPSGAKEGSISVAIQGDTIPEAAQDFHIQLSNPSNAQFLDGATTIQNTVTIDTDDGDSLSVISVGKNLAIDEGDTGLTPFPITLTLSKPATDTLSVKYQTIGLDAKASSDFVAANSTVTFLAGDTSKTINLNVYGDTEVEADEDFTLSLSDPQGMRFENGQPTQEVTLLIRDDDALPAQTLEGTPKNDLLDTTKENGTGDDILDGKQGVDTLIGGDGNDTYYVDNIKDVIIEGDQSQSNAGDDDLVHSTASAYTLPTNVEHLIIDGKLKDNATGNILDNKLTGNMVVNVLSGLAGDDTLDGGSGNDTLTGGSGGDTFIFSSGIKGNKNIDTIKDFVHGQDKIYLSADIFSKLAATIKFDGNAPQSLAKFDPHYLVSGAKVKAVDANSYLLYDTKTGVLSYDEDGNGKLVASSFVTLTGKPTLTLDDFWIS
jgi:Ca2+-binding RTX toxin-like protein